jgi:hypothetical protein
MRDGRLHDPTLLKRVERQDSASSDCRHFYLAALRTAITKQLEAMEGVTSLGWRHSQLLSLS